MTLSDQLRQAIEDDGRPLHQIAKEAGIDQPVLWRFMAPGEKRRDLRLMTADKLAAYFELELRPARRKQ